MSRFCWRRHQVALFLCGCLLAAWPAGMSPASTPQGVEVRLEGETPYPGWALVWGTSLGWDEGTMQLREGYVSLDAPVWGLTLGKRRQKWGPGRFGSLLLSVNQGAGGVAGEWQGELWGCTWTAREIIAPQNTSENRFFLGHRLEANLTPRLRVGVSETAVVSGGFTPWFFNPVPIWPYYLTQHLANQEIPGHNRCANINLGLDLTWEGPWAVLYGELLVDDAQASLENRVSIPDRLGGLAGCEIPLEGPWPGATLNVEYVAIMNYVYSHINPVNNYVWDDGTPIGHWLGPDADALTIQVRGKPSPGLELGFKVQAERHGEGEIGHAWQASDGRSGVFLSGVVERRCLGAVSAAWNLSPETVVEAELGVQGRWNADNVPERRESGALAGVRITTEF